MSKHRRTPHVLLAAGLLGGLAAAPPAQAAGGPPPVPLRIATYNIHAGSGMDNVFDLDRQEAALRALHADVIGLQEVDVHWDARSQNRDLAEELADRLGMHVSFAPIYSLDPVEEEGRAASTGSRSCPGIRSAAPSTTRSPACRRRTRTRSLRPRPASGRSS